MNKPKHYPPHNERSQEVAVENLDFTVRIVRNQADLLKAVAVRHAAYARHKPEFADKLRMPEPDDTADDCFVLLAERKCDQVALGSMRVRVNSDRPLSLQQQVQLPVWTHGQRLADARRLAVAQGSTSVSVRVALFKAYFQRLLMLKVDWSIVSARPPLTRMYERLLFADILDGRTYIPDALLKDPHVVLAFEVATAERRWTAAQHPLTAFMFHTIHPDIDVCTGSAIVDKHCLLSSLASADASRAAVGSGVRR